MRILAPSALAISVALLASSLVGTATAQTPGTCGPVAYSVADQKYVGVPCTAATPKAEADKPAPCGPVAYSVADGIARIRKAYGCAFSERHEVSPEDGGMDAPRHVHRLVRREEGVPRSCPRSRMEERSSLLLRLGPEDER